MIFQTRDCCSLSPGGVQVPETRGPSSLPVFVASGVAPGTVETARQIVLILLYVLQISIINDMELMGVVRRTSTGCARLRKRGYPTQVLRVGAADFVGGWANLGCCLIRLRPPLDPSHTGFSSHNVSANVCFHLLHVTCHHH